MRVRKKEQPAAQHPRLCAERCLSTTRTRKTVQKGTRHGWSYDTVRVTAPAAGVHRAPWEGKAATQADPWQLCVTVRRQGGPVGLTHAQQRTTK